MVVEDLNPATMSLDEVRKEYQELCDELINIDNQLSVNRDKFHTGHYPAKDYWNWRARAVAAKGHITNQVRACKARIRELNPPRGHTPDEWKRKCMALVSGLRQAIDIAGEDDICLPELVDLIDQWDEGTL